MTPNIKTKDALAAFADNITSGELDKAIDREVTHQPAPSVSPNLRKSRKASLEYSHVVVEDKEFTCYRELVDPEDVTISQVNPRNPRFITEKNPACITLANNIRKNRQREPVYARKVGATTEILAGRRRTWAVNYINKNLLNEGEERLPLDCWIIKDIDATYAKKLSISENEGRDDLSPYEQAILYDAEFRELGFETVKAFAEYKSMERTTMQSYMTLAKLEENLVASVYSPNKILLSVGIACVRLCDKIMDVRGTSYYEDHVLGSIVDSQFEDSKFLKTYLLAFLPASKPRSPTNRKGKLYASQDGKVTITISPNRKIREKVKVDFNGVNEGKLLAAVDQFAVELGLTSSQPKCTDNP